MATLDTQTSSASNRRHDSLKIDMTPMVDLGFLLITFFIFTATLSQPRVTRLIMPGEGASSAVPASRSLTLLLGGDKAFVYEGLWEDALAADALTAADYSLQNGLGKHIRQKQNRLPAKEDLIVLIKPLSSASYQRVITALDEMQINGVTKYALTEPTAAERELAGKR